jgi:TonB family protein
MILLITYLVKVFICSGVLYGYYALALKNTPIHQWNRYYLLMATLLSLVLPLLQIPVSFYSQPEQPTYTTQLISLRELIIYGGKGRQQIASFPALCLVFYISIVTIFIVRFLLNLRRIYLLAKTCRKDENTGFILLESEQIQSPFSFFNNIFWSGNIAPDSKEGQQILRHELAHITGRHTTDKMLMETICALLWINPFFHLLKRELSMVHEFIADQAATDEDTAPEYARTILLLTLQSKQLPGVNNFSQSPVKRRILMLFMNKHNNTIMKKSIVLPIVVTLIAFISFQQKNLAQDTSQKKNEAPAPVREPGKEVFTMVSEPPTFKGGEDALAQFLAKNIKYPKAAAKHKKGGTIFVQFVVEPDGTITNVKTVGEVVGFGLEEESMRVARQMPKWQPGKHEGKPVAVQFNLPIKYTLEF